MSDTKVESVQTFGRKVSWLRLDDPQHLLPVVLARAMLRASRAAVVAVYF